MFVVTLFKKLEWFYNETGEIVETIQVHNSSNTVIHDAMHGQTTPEAIYAFKLIPDSILDTDANEINITAWSPSYILYNEPITDTTAIRFGESELRWIPRHPSPHNQYWRKQWSPHCSNINRYIDRDGNKQVISDEAWPKAGHDFSECDFRGTHLSGDLQGINFSGANLAGVCIAGADLSNTDLRGANLFRAYANSINFSGANLTNCNLSHAMLSSSNFYKADLTNADCSGATMHQTTLAKAILTGTNMKDIIGRKKPKPKPKTAAKAKTAKK
jgi:hypothetical protein